MKRICQNVTNVTKWHWRNVAVQAIPKLEDCQVTEDKVASRSGYPGTRFSSIYQRSSVLQKPWRAYWPYRPCYA